jgi:hypothetical protein
MGESTTRHVEQFPDINKLCNVVSCWIYEYIGILLRVHPILHISRIRVNVDIVCRIWCHMHSVVYGALVISVKANKSFDILKLFFLSYLVHRPVFKLKTIKSRLGDRFVLNCQAESTCLRYVMYHTLYSEAQIDEDNNSVLFV